MAAARRSLTAIRVTVATCAIDHLVITAPSLAAGAAYVQRALGVGLQPGGEHPRMGTHNLLLPLGDAAYLEVIAVNPSVPPPGRPRWFDLDGAWTSTEPRLSAWVARTSDIHEAAAVAGEDLGVVEAMSRGALEWQITVPPDGRPPLDGAAPALIQWPADRHPARQLRDSGCRLLRLEVRHADPARVAALLGRLGLRDAVAVTPWAQGRGGQLAAVIATPHGPRGLGLADAGR